MEVQARGRCQGGLENHGIPNDRDLDGGRTRIGLGGWYGRPGRFRRSTSTTSSPASTSRWRRRSSGGKGVTIAPAYTRAAFGFNAECSHIDDNTNWPAFGHDQLPISTTTYPVPRPLSP